MKLKFSKLNKRQETILDLINKQEKISISQNRDFVVIKKSPIIDFSYVKSKLKKIGKNISQQDINQAVLSVK